MPTTKHTTLVFSAFVAFAVAFTGGCNERDLPSRKPERRPRRVSATTRTSLHPLDKALNEWLQAAVQSVAKARRCLRADQDLRLCRQHYLTLRRAIAASFVGLRFRSELGVEVLLGPERASDEGGGALAALDQAWQGEKAAGILRWLQHVERALQLFVVTSSRRALPWAGVLQALSDRSYTLGLQLAEADQGVAERPDAVLADIRGSLDGILNLVPKAVAAVGSDTSAEPSRLREAAKPLQQALRSATSSWGLSHRAKLVRATGQLGVAVRALARTKGIALRLPYRARYPQKRNRWNEPIHALIIPARRPDIRSGDADAIAKLGRRLFFDRKLSQKQQRACADCHQPQRAFTDGLPAPRSLKPGVSLRRNTPTLLYADLNAAQFWDGRVASPERQALGVIHNRAEMGASPATLLRRLSASRTYSDSFARLFADGIQLANVGRALAAFQATYLVPATAPIDRFAREQEPELPSQQAAGFDLFVGKARCARCHIPPSFAGSRPRDFATPVFANVGVPADSSGKMLDDDPGRLGVTGQRVDRGAFKTPTLRNIGRTAPYFHHGRFKTLESVLTFYLRGGGRGQGLPVPYQDADVRRLQLSPKEEQLLLIFLRRALRDAPEQSGLSTPPR